MNPNDFQTIYANAQGESTFATRQNQGQEEVISLTTGKSNMSYHQPEKVMQVQNHTHHFVLVDVRDCECSCGATTTLHPLNFKEDKGVSYVRYQGQDYTVSR